MTRPAVEVDHSLCIGSDLCTHTAPGTFKLGSDGLAHVTEGGEDAIEAIVRASDECPAQAIFVRRSEGTDEVL